MTDDDYRYSRNLLGMLLACLVRQTPDGRWTGIDIGAQPGARFESESKDEVIDWVMTSAEEFAETAREDFHRTRAGRN